MRTALVLSSVAVAAALAASPIAYAGQPASAHGAGVIVRTAAEAGCTGGARIAIGVTAADGGGYDVAFQGGRMDEGTLWTGVVVAQPDDATQAETAKFRRVTVDGGWHGTRHVEDPDLGDLSFTVTAFSRGQQSTDRARCSITVRPNSPYGGASACTANAEVVVTATARRGGTTIVHWGVDHARPGSEWTFAVAIYRPDGGVVQHSTANHNGAFRERAEFDSAARAVFVSGKSDSNQRCTIDVNQALSAL